MQVKEKSKGESVVVDPLNLLQAPVEPASNLESYGSRIAVTKRVSVIYIHVFISNYIYRLPKRIPFPCPQCFIKEVQRTPRFP